MAQVDAKKLIEKDFGQKQQTYFDSNYAQKTHINWLRFERRALMEAMTSDIEGADIVADIGCGPALLYPSALKNARKYFAVDLVQSNLDSVASTDEKVETIQANIDEFDCDFSDAPDLVICSGSLEYSQDPVGNFRKIVSSMKPGAVVVASFPNKANPDRLVTEYIQIPVKNVLAGMMGKSRNYRRRLVSRSSVTQSVREVGGTLRDIQYVGYVIVPYPFTRAFPKASFRLAKFLQKVAPALGVMATEFVVKVAK